MAVIFINNILFILRLQIIDIKTTQLETLINKFVYYFIPKTKHSNLLINIFLGLI